MEGFFHTLLVSPHFVLFLLFLTIASSEFQTLEMCGQSPEEEENRKDRGSWEAKTEDDAACG